MTDNGHAQLAATRAKVLHLSDLHFGRHFNEHAWTHVCIIVGELKPDLVLITGDLVDSPYRWRLREALDAVRKLEAMLPPAGVEAETGANGQTRVDERRVIVVPGNHDTRIFGVLPIPVRLAHPYLLGGLAAAGWLAYALAPWPASAGAGRLLLAAAAFLTGLFALRLAFGDFGKQFKDFIPAEPVYFDKLGLIIYAFDSSTEALFGARGKVSQKLFVDARGPRAARPDDDGSGAPPYRIAILHHHPLPIPYDHASEPLMVVDNAGSFLSEVTKLRVRLVLHGHKHHRHFSRTTINAGDGEEHEVAVLSTGTPTRSGRTDGPVRHFNFLTLDARGSMKYTAYLAEGDGSFTPQAAGEVETPGLAEKRHYDGLVQRHGVKCRSNVVTADITPDGDMSVRQEILGFKVVEPRAARGQPPWLVGPVVGTGHIDGFVVDNIDKNPHLSVYFVEEERTLKKHIGHVAFGREVMPEDAPLDFFSQYHALNSFAMSVRQHMEMYPRKPGEAGDFNEHFEQEIRSVPAEALDIVIKFPEGFKLDDGSPRLVVVESDEEAVSPVYTGKYEERLKYYPAINVAVAHIDHPPLHLTFRVLWTLTDVTPPAAGPLSLVGKVDEVVETLLRAPSDPALAARLSSLLEVVGEIAKEVFELGDDEQLELSLMAYDRDAEDPERPGEKAPALRLVAANFPLDEAMLAFRMKYGNGLAGRAYKMNKGRMFIKRLAIEKRTPSYYYPIDGQVYDLEHDTDIQEVIISFPLRHPDDPGLIYAVLSISTREKSSELQDIKERSVLEDTSVFREAVDGACYDVLSDLL